MESLFWLINQLCNTVIYLSSRLRPINYLKMGWKLMVSSAKIMFITTPQIDEHSRPNMGEHSFQLASERVKIEFTLPPLDLCEMKTPAC